MSSLPSDSARSSDSATRVLVVDVQTPRRLVVGRGLAARGYEVFLAGSGSDALAQLARDPGIGAVVSDIAIPAAGAVQFVPEILHRRRAGVPVLFLSDGDTTPTLLKHPLIGALRKPVRVMEVCDVLDQLLGQAASFALQRRSRDMHSRQAVPPPGSWKDGWREPR